MQFDRLNLLINWYFSVTRAPVLHVHIYVYMHIHTVGGQIIN